MQVNTPKWEEGDEKKKKMKRKQSAGLYKKVALGATKKLTEKRTPLQRATVRYWCDVVFLGKLSIK